MFNFFKKNKKNKENKKKETQAKYSPSLHVNYVFQEYTEETAEIEQITDEIFSYEIVEVGGPMSLEEAIECNYPTPPSHELEKILFPIYYIFDDLDMDNPKPLLISSNKEKVLNFIEDYQLKFKNS